MAELGTAAAVAQLAGQLLSCAITLYKIVKEIKGAPQHMQDLLFEVQMVALSLQSLRALITSNEAIEKNLQYTTKIMEELHGKLTELISESKKKGFRAKLKMGSLMMVVKKDEVQELVERLRAAQISLQTALTCYCVQLGISREEILVTLITNTQETDSLSLVTTSASTSDINTQQTDSLSLVTTSASMINTNQSCQTLSRKGKRELKVQTTWLGLYNIQTVSFQTIDYKDPSEDLVKTDHTEKRIVPASWTGLRGFTYCQGLENGVWKYWFKHGRIVPQSAQIFQACIGGDLDQIISLLAANKASIHDTTETGLTLLHVAAFHRRSNVCEWLIDNGANSSEVDVKEGRTPLHCAVEGIEKWGMFSDGAGFIEWGDSTSRAKDTLQTIRILVEKGQCDPMTKKLARVPRYAETVLHQYVGPIEAFTYLVNQEHFEIDLYEEDNRNMPIVESIASQPDPAVVEMMMYLSRSGKVQPYQVVWVANKHFSYAAMKLAAIYHEWNIMTCSKKYWGLRKQEYRNAALRLIRDMLAAGADPHYIDSFVGTTPLKLLIHGMIPMYDKRKSPLGCCLFDWFDSLRNAGFDLQDYLRTECAHYPDHIFSTIDEYEFSRPNMDFKRTIRVINHLGTMDLLFWIRQEVIPSTSEMELQIPGAWKKEPPLWCAWDTWEVPLSSDPQNIVFRIRPLRNSIQEFQLLDDDMYEGVIESIHEA